MTLRLKSFLLIAVYVCLASALCAAVWLLPEGILPPYVRPDWLRLGLPIALIVFAVFVQLALARVAAGRVRRLVRLIDTHRESPELAERLAATPHDEVGRIAHEMSVCLRQAERERQETQRATQSLALAQRRVAAVLDVLPIAVMILDDQGRVIQFSRPAGRLLGWKPAEASRKPLGHFFPEPFGDDDTVFQKVRNRLADPARNGAAVSFRVTGRSAAGVEASFQMHVQELAGSNRQEYVCLVRARDDDARPGASHESVQHAPAHASSPKPAHTAGEIGAPVKLEQVDVCAVLDSTLSELDTVQRGRRDRVRLMKPARAMAHAQRQSLDVVFREVLEAAFSATFATATVNITVTETADAVGVIVEAPVAAQTLDTPAPPRLTFAAEVVRALGGALDIYDDIPGVVQTVVELRTGPTESAPESK